MNKKYENKKNGNIATLIAQDEKCKTVTLEYQDGKTTVLSSSTLKRWWKEIENELVPMPGTEDPDWGKKHWGDEEEKAGDGTPLKEVGKEIAEQAKQKAEQAKQKAKESTSYWDKAQIASVYKDLLEMLGTYEGISYKLYERIPNFILVKNGKKSIYEIRVGRLGVTVNCRAQDVPKGVETTHANNYYMPEKFRLGNNYAGVINALTQSFI